MESKFKVIICLVFLLIGGLSFNYLSQALASDFEILDDGNGNKILVNYTGEGGEVIIPDELDVTEIGESSFRNSDVTIVKSNTVISIGKNAFEGCNNLESVSFPNAKEIRQNSFENCMNLKSVDFPNAETIEFGAFSECDKLESVSFPKVKTINSYAFDGCNSLTTVEFPKVETIGGYAFRDCIKLSEFLGDPNITSMANNTFIKEENGDMAPLSLDIEKYLGFTSIFVNNSYKEPDTYEEYYDDADYLYTSGNTMWYSQKRTRIKERGEYHKDETYTYVKI